MTDSSDPSTATVEDVDVSALRLPNAVRALAHKDFAIFWLGQIVSNTGTWMQGLALGWLLYEMTGSELQLGLLGMIGSLPSFFLTLPFGVIVDRFDKRHIAIITQSLAMVHAAALAVLTLTGRIEVWQIFALAAFLGVVSALDIPARQAMVVELVGKNDLLNAISLNSAVFNVTRIVGPAVAGGVVAYYGPGVCFAINAISYVAVVISLFLIRTHPLHEVTGNERMLDQIREGMSYVRRDPLISSLLFMTAISSVFAMQYATQMPAFAVNVYNVGAKGQGMLMSAAGVGALAGAIAVAAYGHRWRQGAIVTVGSLMAPLGLIAFAMAPTFPIALVCLVILGFGVIAFLAVSNSMVQTASPDHLRGRVVSARNFVFMGLAPLGSLQVGAMAQYIGVREAVFLGGVVFLLSSLYVALRVDTVWKSE